MYGGVLVCKRCGSTSINKLRNLSNRFRGAHEDDHLYGSTYIRRYNKGRAPLGHPIWPYNEFGISHEAIINNSQTQLNNTSNAFMKPSDEAASEEADSDTYFIGSSTESGDYSSN